MAKREHEVIVLDGQKKETIARLWWDGKKVQTDNKAFLKQIKGAKLTHTMADGPDFLDAVVGHFRNGYLQAYRVGAAAKNEKTDD